MKSVQFEAIDHVWKLAEESKKNGKNVDEEVGFLVDKCRYGDIYGRISWNKLLYNIKTAKDIEFYYRLFH